MSKKTSFKYIIFVFFTIILLFQDLLQTYIPFIQFFDEIIALLAIPILIVRMLNNRNNFEFTRYNVFILLLYLVLVSVGLYSSIKFRYQPMSIALSDLLLVSKFFLAYMLSEMLFDVKFLNNNKNKIEVLLKSIVIMFFLLTVLNYIFKIWPQQDYRFGIMSNQIFYNHPTVLAASCIFLLALSFLIQIKDMEKYNFLILIILLSTLRFKAIGAVILILFIVFYISKSNKKISMSKLGLISLIIAVFAWDHISLNYINMDGSARKVLNETSIRIAKDYFPVGTGFGTYASYFSSVSYSPIYSIYGISQIWGLQQNGYASFFSDVFWPMIIGQFGIIGTIAYVGMIILIFKKIQESYSAENKNIYIAKIICLAYLVISSTSESAFAHFIAIPLALIIGINTSKNKNIKNERK